MNQKELPETFMMISNWKTLWSLWIIDNTISVVRVDPYPAKFIYLNFHPLEVVSRYRDPQLQVVWNYTYLFILSTDIYKSWRSDTHFIPNNRELAN